MGFILDFGFIQGFVVTKDLGYPRFLLASVGILP